MITVYTISDPTNKGPFIWNHGLIFEFMPFYVGITSDYQRRKRQHELGDSGVNRLKESFMKDIRNKGAKPLFNIYHEFSNYEEAYFVEKLLIGQLGRINKNGGCLCNNTDGGRGTKGRVHKDCIPRLKRQKRIQKVLTKEERSNSAQKAIQTMKKNNTLKNRTQSARKAMLKNFEIKLQNLLKGGTVSCVEYVSKYVGKHAKGTFECVLHGKFEQRHDVIKRQINKNLHPCVECRRMS